MVDGLYEHAYLFFLGQFCHHKIIIIIIIIVQLLLIYVFLLIVTSLITTDKDRVECSDCSGSVLERPQWQFSVKAC